MSDFALSLVVNDGLAVDPLGDLNDGANGLQLGVGLPDAEDVLRRVETDSPFVGGVFEVVAVPDGGRLDFSLVVSGSTWLEMSTRYATARGWWRQTGTFWLDYTVKGYGLRYVARRPDVTPAPVGPVNLAENRRTFLLSFPVQPNPVVI